jgi:hypothetical protein
MYRIFHPPTRIHIQTHTDTHTHRTQYRRLSGQQLIPTGPCLPTVAGKQRHYCNTDIEAQNNCLKIETQASCLKIETQASCLKIETQNSCLKIEAQNSCLKIETQASCLLKI